ncbi:MAG TPA: hypothetical protein VGO22_23810 [Pseudorhizobium sp.]|jgi:hypothetical protein|nr:hypothetical protein [Pseudorhizobium sp.]
MSMAELPRAVERAIARSIDISGSPHPTVPVHEVVDTVMLETQSKSGDRPALVQQVCLSALRRRYVLAFL